LAGKWMLATTGTQYLSLCAPSKTYDLNPSVKLNLVEFTTPIEPCAQAQRQAVLVVHTTPIFTLLVFPYHWCKSRTYAPALSCTWLSYQPHLGSKFARLFMYNAMIGAKCSLSPIHSWCGVFPTRHRESHFSGFTGRRCRSTDY
jgi:hypothetical protein